MAKMFLNNLGPKIKIANTLIEKQLNNEFAKVFDEYSLTGAQISLLLYLYDSKGRTVTQKEIADVFVLSHPTVRGIVKRLADSNLIATSHLEHDQRQVVLTLTNQGFNLINDNAEKIRIIMDNVNQRIILGFSAQEVEGFEQAIEKIISNF